VGHAQAGAYFLQDGQSDLLFSISRRSGEKLFLYIVFEHQTTEDKWMRLRLLGYELELCHEVLRLTVWTLDSANNAITPAGAATKSHSLGEAAP
jgi:Putative transposase, YhgA-like